MYLCGRECKIIRDQQTLKSKGYGFVSFVNKEVRFSPVAAAAAAADNDDDDDDVMVVMMVVVVMTEYGTCNC